LLVINVGLECIEKNLQRTSGDYYSMIVNKSVSTDEFQNEKQA
jgi:hypothetical protein